MAQPDRPLRADAARNRARVLEVAYDTFAAEGLSVPIDEIARRAGVGAGTVYRHFPTKEDLFRAVVEDRIQRIVNEGRDLLASDDPGALFSFLRSMVLQWGAADRGLADALAGIGIDIKTAMPDAEEAFLGLLGELLKAAQDAGRARPDVDVADVKAILSGCLAMQVADPAAADRLTEVVLDGLRAR
jgi:AcrR family transcriptional regulator